jgi:hypothetical protein
VRGTEKMPGRLGAAGPGQAYQDEQEDANLLSSAGGSASAHTLKDVPGRLLFPTNSWATSGTGLEPYPTGAQWAGFNRPWTFSQSRKRSVQVSDGRSALRIPNP